MPGDNKLVTEYFLAQNFSPKSGVTPGSDNVRAMDCDQIKTRYNVDIAGVSSTGLRCPGQNQLTAISSTVVAIDTYSDIDYLGSAVTTMSITLPATVQAGKLILFWVMLDSVASISTPSGYTVLKDDWESLDVPPYKSYALGYKLATGNEGGTSINCTLGYASYGCIGYAIFSGVKQTSPYVASTNDYKREWTESLNFDYSGQGYDRSMNIIISNTNLTVQGTVSHTAGYTLIGGYNRGNTNIPSIVYKSQSGNVWDNYSKSSNYFGRHNGIRIQIIPQ